MPTAPGAGLAVEERGLQNRINVVGTSLIDVTGQYLESGAVKSISFWDPADAGYVMNTIADMILRGETLSDGVDLGIEGYRRLIQAPGKENLFYGSAWIDLTRDNMSQFSP
jgi:simple sugar transport system substrate-binding protein